MRYRRSGLVTARRLSAPLSWQSASGDVLAGQTGDWLVESEDAGRRTVAAEQFPHLYEHIGGDCYRRSGTVTARRVSSRESVATLEGDATAEPGSWLVSDQSGNTWPVPDDVFRRAYEAVED